MLQMKYAMTMDGKIACYTGDSKGNWRRVQSTCPDTSKSL